MRRQLYLLSFSIFLSLIAIFSFYHLLPLYFKDVGIKQELISGVYTVLLFFYNFFQIVGSWLVGRLSAKRVYVLSSFLVAIGMIFSGLIHNGLIVFSIFAGIYALWGIQLPAQSLLLKGYDKDIERAFSIMDFFALAGILIGPFLGSLVLRSYSIRVLILGAGIMEIGVSVLRVFLKDTGETYSERLNFEILKHRGFLKALLLISMAFLIFYSTVDGPFIPRLLEDGGYSRWEISLIFGAGTLLAMLFIPISYLLIKLTDLAVVIGGCILAHSIMIFFWWFHIKWLWLLILSFLPVQPVYAQYIPLFLRLTPEKYHKEAVGFGSAIAGSIGSFSPFFFAIQGLTPFFILLFGILSTPLSVFLHIDLQALTKISRGKFLTDRFR